jgi:hypothetical protein
MIFYDIEAFLNKRKYIFILILFSEDRFYFSASGGIFKTNFYIEDLPLSNVPSLHDVFSLKNPLMKYSIGYSVV